MNGHPHAPWSSWHSGPARRCLGFPQHLLKLHHVLPAFSGRQGLRFIAQCETHACPRVHRAEEPGSGSGSMSRCPDSDAANQKRLPRRPIYHHLAPPATNEQAFRVLASHASLSGRYGWASGYPGCPLIFLVFSSPPPFFILPSSPAKASSINLSNHFNTRTQLLRVIP